MGGKRYFTSSTLVFILSGVLVGFVIEPIYASPFSTNVQNDVYGVAQGGVINGVPTASEPAGASPYIYDNVNLLYSNAGLGTPFSNNKDLDPLFKGSDEIWRELGDGGIALIGMQAKFSDTVGLYTDVGVGTIQTPLLGPNNGNGFAGDGTLANPFPATMTGLSKDQQFGWYLDSATPSIMRTFFSEPILNNPQLDQMMTFNLGALSGTTVYVDFGSGPTLLQLGSNIFLIAWEDKPFNGNTVGDDDYNDMVYLVTDITSDSLPISTGTSNSYEDPTIGKLKNGKQVVEDGFCIIIAGEVDCVTVDSNFVQHYDLREVFSESSITIGTTVYCSNGVDRCNYIAIGVSPLGTNMNSAIWKIILQKDHRGQWSQTVVDEHDYLGDVTTTTQIVNDNKNLAGSFNIELIKSSIIQPDGTEPENLQINVEVRDSKGGYRDFKLNEGILIKDPYAYPKVETSYEKPIPIEPVCLNENPNKRYTCAFDLVKKWTINNAQDILNSNDITTE